MQRRALLVGFGLAAGVLLACEPRVSVGDNRDGSPLSIGFVPKSQDNSIFTLTYGGTTDAAVDRARETGLTVSVTNLAPQKADRELQIKKVQEAIALKPRGMIVSCVEDGVTESITTAVANGISVITFDSDCPKSGRLDFYGTDNTMAGIEAADLLAAALKDTGGTRIAILSGLENAANLNERVSAFSARLKEAYPTLKLLDTFHCEEEPLPCKLKLEELLKQYPDLDGLFVTGLWGVEAACDCKSTEDCNCHAEERMPNWHTAKLRGLKTVAFDAVPFELQLMREGYLSALVGQKYYDWGYCTVTSMFDYLIKDKLVPLGNSDHEVVTPLNVDDAWAKWVAAYQVDAGRAITPACQW